MPASIPTPQEVATMAFLSWAAYDENGQTAEQRLEGSGWQVLGFAELGPHSNGLLSEDDFEDGFYELDAAAALVVERDGVIAIAIRGSENPIDLFAAGFDQEDHFTNLQPLMNAVLGYVENADPGEVSQLYVTGHSLGGIMAELFALDYADWALDLGIDVSVATFGSPGTARTSGSNDLTNAIFHVGHTDDEVFTRDVPAVGDFIRRGPSALQIIIPDEDFTDADEHMPALYQRSLTLLTESSLFQDYLNGSTNRSIIVDAHFPELVDGQAYLDLVAQVGNVATLVIAADGDDIVFGTSASDWIDGGAGENSLWGAGGDDTLLGGDASDNLQGGLGNDTLTGLAGGDEYVLGQIGLDTFFAIAPGQGEDLIVDQGGSGKDIIRVHGGDVLTSLDQFSFLQQGADLLITANNGEGEEVLRIIVRDANSEAGHVEELHLFVGDADAALVHTLPGSGAPAPPSSFADDFNRPDGAVGNGWQIESATIGADLSLVGGALTAASGGVSAALRPIDFSNGITVSATVTHMNGFNGLPNRYDTTFVVGNQGDLVSGYGIAVGRGDATFSDSTVYLVHNGAVVASASSTFQFGASIEVSFSIATDGSVSGAVSGDGNSFTFAFGPRAIDLQGGNFAVIQPPPDSRASVLTPSTIDNLTITDVAVIFDDFSPASPATNGVLGIGSQLTGSIETPLDRDWFAVSLTAGVAYRFDLVGADGGGGTLLDPFMRVRDANGVSLAANDDANGNDSSITFLAPASGVYYVSVGGDLVSGGAYTLRSAVVGDAQGFILLPGVSVWDAGTGFDVLTLALSDTNEAVKLDHLTPDFINPDRTIGFVGIGPELPGVTFATMLNFTGVESFNLSTGSANDHLEGGEWGDVLTGNGGMDELFGWGGGDVLGGGADNDRLRGDLGDDMLEGGAGADALEGGDGFDTASYGGAASGVTADLLGNAANTGDAAGDTYTSIENLFGSGHNDTLRGDGWNNVISSLDGDDIVEGRAGDDTLSGGGGGDFLDGGLGSDVMSGGLGNDTFVVDTIGDIVTELSAQGTDTVQTILTYTLGANVENLALLGAAALNGTGNALANTLIGNAANNVLSGGGGNDTIDGGLGSDAMAGGAGNDTIIVDTFGDTVSEALGEGTDTVLSAVNYALGANLENLTLTGSANLNGAGNALNNVMSGNSGNNVLNGGAGADAMAGANGNDTYVVDSASDTVTEGNPSGGTDTVRTSISYTLVGTGYVENLELTGSSNINGAGNFQFNRIWGNSGANTLSGLGGDDILDGGTGADTMLGGQGNDYFYVDNAGDVVTELSGEGTDTLQANVSFTLVANVENMVLGTSNNINATGNGLNNRINANIGNNTIDGGAGADQMFGGLGNDTYVVDNAGDTVSEGSAGGGVDLVLASVTYTLVGTGYAENLTLTGAGDINATGNFANNALTGNAGANLLSGGTGSDTLNGGLGADTLTGGAHNDAFVFASALGGGNVDAITDFAVVDDVMHLSTGVFGIAAGTLAAGAFVIGAAAADADDRIVYDSATGALFYDADGDGASAAVQFATLATGLALTNADFFGVNP